MRGFVSRRKPIASDHLHLGPASPASPADALKADPFDELRAEIWALKAPRYGFASLIVADFPALFAEFRGKRFSLLWRGSRDGFRAKNFHGRCDGHANTLTFIEDTAGNIFGGFTPLEWESPSNGQWKAAPSLKSFLFTLKNPHDFPARTFALNAENKNEAIHCNPSLGPNFSDITIADHCNSSASHISRFGSSYANDLGFGWQTFFTGSTYFTVKEIEVFEITD
jgi:hypothetical protein